LDEAPGNRPGLPVYSRAEVAKHKTPETGVWVTFKDGVYDVTDFAEKHPGGNKILLAAGSAVDPFWVIYQQHNHAHVREILAKYRIGSLDPAEMASVADAAAAIGDPYAGDPPRSPLFIVHSAKPYNAEPPAQLLPDAFLTPAEVLFVRHHLPVPDIDPAKHKLTVEVQREGQPPRTVVYTLAELQARFPAHSVVAALTCSGNRRAAMAAAKEARGLAWRVGAMGNVEWRGVRLRDVLADAGVGEGDVEAGWLRHVQFEGMDRDPVAGTCYGASIPADKALDPRGDVLLAWEMNGAPLTRDHGAPLRAVVPGTTGARQVKWVGRVVASGQESASLWQQKDYKLFPPTMDWGNVDFGAMPAMQEMPVASAICEPAEGEAVPRDREGMVRSGRLSAGLGAWLMAVRGGLLWVRVRLRKGCSAGLTSVAAYASPAAALWCGSVVWLHPL
jgi:sulfite oxidase